MYKTLILCLILLFFHFSCAKLEEEENKSETTTSLGDKNGDAVIIEGYDYNGIKEVSATITPYERGLKILFTPVSSAFICSVSNYIIQSGSQLQFGSIADTKAKYDEYSFYNGYVESGAFDSCATYQVDTTWILFSSKIGFNSDRNYQVTLDDVTSDGFTAKTATILISQ